MFTALCIIGVVAVLAGGGYVAYGYLTSKNLGDNLIGGQVAGGLVEIVIGLLTAACK